MQTERRVMHFDIPFEEVVNILIPKDCLVRSLDTNLPPDVKIMSVEADQNRRVFRFYITSESFEEVIPGCHSKAFLLVFTKAIPEQTRDLRGCHNCEQISPDPCVDCCQEGILTHWKSPVPHASSNV
jgi:hypothetical protein